MPKTATPIEKLIKRETRRKNLAKFTPGATIELDEKREKAMELRLQHKSYRQIAKELGTSEKVAFEWINNEHEQRLASMSQKSGLIRDEQNRVYDELLERWLPLAIDEKLNVGEIRFKNNGDPFEVSLKDWEASAAATDKVLRILELKAKINGLMLTKVEVKSNAPLIGQEVFKVVQDIVASFNKPIDVEFEKEPLLEDKKDGPTG